MSKRAAKTKTKNKKRAEKRRAAALEKAAEKAARVAGEQVAGENAQGRVFDENDETGGKKAATPTDISHAAPLEILQNHGTNEGSWISGINTHDVDLGGISVHDVVSGEGSAHWLVL